MSDLKLTILFPVYNDENTVEIMVKKSEAAAEEVLGKGSYEIIIVNDCSPDLSGEIADELAKTRPHLKVLHNESNLGYGATVRRGFGSSRGEWICQTDGDDEYDISDLKRLYTHAAYYDLIITFRYVKLYSTVRIFISWVYNRFLRSLFRMPFRDISTGLRMVRRELLENVDLSATSPFLGAELAIKALLMGYRIGEVGIQTFPRTFGKGASVSSRNITRTIKEALRIRGEIFSDQYQLPEGRERDAALDSKATTS